MTQLINNDDKNDVGYKFDHRFKNLPEQVLRMLSKIDELKISFKYEAKMSPAVFSSLRKSTLVTSAGASTRIEGSKLSDTEVEKIMRGMAIQKFEDRDSQEVVGYLETLSNVFSSFENLHLRESTIKHLHAELLKIADKDRLHKGGYKKKENIVGVMGPDGKVAHVIFQTTLAWLTPKEMTELVEYTNVSLQQDRFHPLLLVANFVIEFLRIHPFEDGNGRLSRILTNMLLLKHGYSFTQYVSHEQIIESRKDGYYLALRSSQASFETPQENIIPWLNYFLSVILNQGEKAMELAKVKNATSVSVVQEKILSIFKTHEFLTIKILEAETDIKRATIKNAINELVKQGQINKLGAGRATRYILKK